MRSAESQQKLSAIRLSFFTALGLALLKLTFGFLTNSVAILSLAVDSLGDLFSSAFNYFFLHKAEQPADEDHHYGHGKFENFASLVQGGILIATAGFIVYRAIEKLLKHEEIYQAELGIGAIVICFAINLIVGRKVRKVGTEHKSDLLHLEATHLLMDSYLYLIVLGALFFSYFKFHFFDPIASLVVAAYIIWVAAKAGKSSFDVLMDKSLTDQENEEIVRIIKDHYPSILGYDRFQTRKSGSGKFVNFRLFICRKMSLGQAHDILDHIEKEIMKKIPHCDVMSHAEPAREDCSKHQHELHPRHFEEV